MGKERNPVKALPPHHSHQLLHTNTVRNDRLNVRLARERHSALTEVKYAELRTGSAKDFHRLLLVHRYSTHSHHCSEPCWTYSQVSCMLCQDLNNSPSHGAENKQTGFLMGVDIISSWKMKCILFESLKDSRWLFMVIPGIYM